MLTEWNEILREEWYSREEPDEIVVNFANSLKKKRQVIRVLDLGCGAGRHLVFLSKQRFEAHGVDVSETGLTLTKEKLRRQNLEVYLAKCDMKNLPHVNSCFDAVVCLHTIYHQRLEGIQKTIFEIQRILRQEGLLLINFLSKRTYSYGKGIEIEENTFTEQSGVEAGVLHHFTDEKEIRYLFKNFKILNLQLVEKTVEGKLRSRWILTAKT
ncbi:MAG: class I SAM-dependent methyltransferase [Candidatus Bathyarchaeota archaeon]|jgi:ubiquinone/menaquinone biosynthesis C-methylase UbiE|nr:class I SAM-dependent methyltransferase [Candidatus Bathyarchaeota archaeon A05DMB-5]MDH7557176.1 class I SAM-dependent methyltransferase [Candidatus Bathyarchaeota archaeon]